MKPTPSQVLNLIPSSFKQARQIANHLVTTGDISIREAQDLYRISSPWKIVSMLKAKYNLNITSERKEDLTGKVYTRYHLAA